MQLYLCRYDLLTKTTSIDYDGEPIGGGGAWVVDR
jgi:hypothetical protein